MAKRSKKEKSELDAILDQLKNAYGPDSAKDLENEPSKNDDLDAELDSLFDTEENEDDAELNEILNSLFASDNTQNNPIEETIEETVEDQYLFGSIVAFVDFIRFVDFIGKATAKHGS